MWFELSQNGCIRKFDCLHIDKVTAGLNFSKKNEITYQKIRRGRQGNLVVIQPVTVVRPLFTRRDGLLANVDSVPDAQFPRTRAALAYRTHVPLEEKKKKSSNGTALNYSESPVPSENVISNLVNFVVIQICVQRIWTGFRFRLHPPFLLVQKLVQVTALRTADAAVTLVARI
jgi:hypothetical protein